MEGFLNPKFVTNVKALLGFTRHYTRFILGYAKIAKLLFNLTKKDCKFVWTPIYQGVFVTLKIRLMAFPILIRLDFSQPFILNVDQSIKGVRPILSQKLEKQEQAIAYINKGLSPVHKQFHFMEGKCYAFVWGMMKF